MNLRRFIGFFLAFLLLWGCHTDPFIVTPQQPYEVIPAPDSPETPAEEEDLDDPDLVDWPAVMAYVFDFSVIPEIHLSLSREQWDLLLAYYDENHNTQKYVACDVLYKKGKESTAIPGSGLRLKGNTSRRRPEEGGRLRHVHFGLDFHHWTKDPEHTLKGLRKMDLKWFKDDPVYAREIYSYDLLRSFGVWTAIRDVYARLWIRIGDGPETYMGVYGMMEHIDKDYIRVRQEAFGSKGGNLWKCRYGADLRNPSTDIGVDDNLHDHLYELKTNKEEGFDAAREQLQGFIRRLNSLSGISFDNWISSVTDVSLLLRTYAVNVAVGMWDDMWNNTNNFYLYFDSTSPTSYHFWLIPYDYDNTLGTSLQCGVQSDAARQDPYRWGPPDHPLMGKILQNAAWRAEYRSYLQELCGPGGLSAYEAASSRIRSWHSRIVPFVHNATGEDMTIEDRPAPWGNHGEYRVLQSGRDNFFAVKSATVAGMK